MINTNKKNWTLSSITCSYVYASIILGSSCASHWLLLGPLSRSCHPLIVRELRSACYRTQVRSADFGVAHNFRWELPGSWCHGLKIWKTIVFDGLSCGFRCTCECEGWCNEVAIHQTPWLVLVSTFCEVLNIRSTCLIYRERWGKGPLGASSIEE